jgi:hypothetical protein
MKKHLGFFCFSLSIILVHPIKTLDGIVLTEHQPKRIFELELKGRDKEKSKYSREDVSWSGCKWDEDCSDPNSICQDADPPSQSGECVCNEFYEILSSSPHPSLPISPNPKIGNIDLKCKRRTCHSTKSCPLSAFCSSKGICWPKCEDDLECNNNNGETCDLSRGICLRKCSTDEDCSGSEAKICEGEICRFLEEDGCDPSFGESCNQLYEFELCDSSGCYSRCSRDADCKLNEYCDSSTNFCLRIQCSNDSTCAKDQYCDADSKECKLKGQEADLGIIKYSL